jgi:hypothetical protein
MFNRMIRIDRWYNIHWRKGGKSEKKSGVLVAKFMQCRTRAGTVRKLVEVGSPYDL